MSLLQLIERLKQIEQEAIDKGLDCSEIEVSMNEGEYSGNQAMLEDVDKPKLRKIRDVLWTCSNVDVFAYGGTPSGAYEMWKAILSSRNNAVAY